MTIRICVAGATGWAGAAVARAILLAPGEFTLTGAVARTREGEDIGEALGLSPAGVRITGSVREALQTPTDALIDYTSHEAVRANILTALEMGVRVVAGASGLTAADYEEIGAIASERGLGVIAAGNFSITAALAKRFALIAARYLPSWELIDYANAEKADAPSGTVRELAEELGRIGQPRIEVPIERTHGEVAARGADIAGTRVHSVRLPSYVIAFEAIFGQPSERLTIRHDAGVDAGPYVAGTLLAARRVMDVTGLVRGLDHLMLDN